MSAIHTRWKEKQCKHCSIRCKDTQCDILHWLWFTLLATHIWVANKGPSWHYPTDWILRRSVAEPDWSFGLDRQHDIHHHSLQVGKKIKGQFSPENLLLKLINSCSDSSYCVSSSISVGRSFISFLHCLLLHLHHISNAICIRFFIFM